VEPGDHGITLGLPVPKKWKGVKKGSSIAVNGVCLTVVRKRGDTVYFFCQQETLDVTTLGGLEPGDRVNLEQAMSLGDEIGGHMVQGHVDFTARVDRVQEIGEGWRYRIRLPARRPAGIVLKGSIALDGISLTVSRLTPRSFSVDIIPFTYENTNIQDWKPKTPVNVETDVIGKYVESYMTALEQR
jgi:riboflavin synthase